MRALSIRQPYAELILRGVKTVEYRSRPTRVIGERFHIYASKGSGVGVQGSGEVGEAARRIWSDDLAVAGRAGGDAPPGWLLELAEQVRMIEPGALLPTGVIVGSAVIEKVSRVDSVYRWHLADVERAPTLRKPTGRPQPVWFKPFD